MPPFKKYWKWSKTRSSIRTWPEKMGHWYYFYLISIIYFINFFILQFCNNGANSINISSNLDAWAIHLYQKCNPLASPRNELNANNLVEAKSECDARENCAMFFYEVNENRYFHDDFNTVNTFYFCDETGSEISTRKMNILYNKGR